MDRYHNEKLIGKGSRNEYKVIENVRKKVHMRLG